MIVRHLIATVPLLLAALAACGCVPTPTPDPVRQEAVIRAAEGHRLAAAQTHDFERALTTAVYLSR
jgi:hypothetical protein